MLSKPYKKISDSPFALQKTKEQTKAFISFPIPHTLPLPSSPTSQCTSSKSHSMTEKKKCFFEKKICLHSLNVGEFHCSDNRCHFHVADRHLSFSFVLTLGSLIMWSDLMQLKKVPSCSSSKKIMAKLDVKYRTGKTSCDSLLAADALRREKYHWDCLAHTFQDCICLWQLFG